MVRSPTSNPKIRIITPLNNLNGKLWASSTTIATEHAAVFVNDLGFAVDNVNGRVGASTNTRCTANAPLIHMQFALAIIGVGDTAYTVKEAEIMFYLLDRLHSHSDGSQIILAQAEVKGLTPATEEMSTSQGFHGI